MSFQYSCIIEEPSGSKHWLLPPSGSHYTDLETLKTDIKMEARRRPAGTTFNVKRREATYGEWGSLEDPLELADISADVLTGPPTVIPSEILKEAPTVHRSGRTQVTDPEDGTQKHPRDNTTSVENWRGK